MGDFVATDGLRLHYRENGTGPCVVLVHSFGFDGALWAEHGVVAPLMDAGRSVAALDCRGHGLSDRPVDASVYGVDRLAQDVTELLDHLGLVEADLVAFSMGSYVSLRVLQRERRIRRAVLAGVGGMALAPDPFRGDRLPAGLGTVDAIDTLAPLVPYLSDRLQDGRADARALIELLRAGFTPLDKDFGSVSADVLLLAGIRDDDPEPLARALPRASVRRIDADHGGTLVHPDLVPEIMSFLVDGDRP